jgi:hypothetical protein
MNKEFKIIWKEEVAIETDCFPTFLGYNTRRIGICKYSKWESTTGSSRKIQKVILPWNIKQIIIFI